MKGSRFLGVLLGFFVFLAMSSCIKDEALHTEADIEQATIPYAEQVLHINPSIGNDRTVFRVKRCSGSYLQAPEFVLTEGASIQP